MKTKSFLILCIAVAFLLTNCAESPTNNPVVSKKKVHTEDLYSVDLDDGSKWFVSRNIYDISGNLVEQLDSSDTRQYHYYYVYDNNGRRISGTWSLIDIDFEEYGTVSYEYDAHGNLILETDQDDDGNRRSKITYEYNSNNLLIRRNQLDHDDNIYIYEMIEYDAKGVLVKRTLYIDGELKGTYTYKYDEKGRLIEENGPFPFYPDAIVKTIYKYNSNDEPIEARVYDEDGKVILIYVIERTYYE